jgi:hypothetical protein
MKAKQGAGAVVTLITAAAIFGMVTSAGLAGSPLAEFEEAAVFFEENTTDGDLGLHFKVDGDGWTRLMLFSPPPARLVVNVNVRGNLGTVGLTEVFSESAEPGYDELPRDEFLELFPEGIYTFLGVTTEGEVLWGTTELTQDIPAGAVVVSPTEDQVVDPDVDLALQWQLVADPDAPDSVIEFYEVVVEKDEENELLRVFSVIMNNTDTSITVPEAFLEPGKNYKVEIIAQETSGNRASVEVPFSTSD